MNRTLIAVVVLPALALACDRAAGPAPASWTATHDTIGDTVVVHTTGGSVWQQPMQLVEDLEIGALDGPDEYSFGMITGLAPDAAGGVFVFDGQANSLRYYDSTGRYVRSIGGTGEGPGEFRDALDIALGSDGRLVLYDLRVGRAVVYDPDGTPVAHIPIASGLFTSNALVVDTAGHVFIAVLTGEIVRDRPWPIGYLHLDSAGAIVDTLRAPNVADAPGSARGSFDARKEWILARDRSIVVGVTDRYAIEVRRPDGSVLRLGRDVEPIAVLPEEKAELERINDWYRREQAEHMTPPVPDTKAIWKGLLVSSRGEIWVHRHTTAVRVREPDEESDPARPPTPIWREPASYDVFDRDGRYMGEVRAPRRTLVVTFSDDAVWGIRYGELDEPYAVRMRLEPVSSEAATD